jgi:hypothetical protein
MRKKLLFLAFALAAAITATSRPSAASTNPCGQFGHVHLCGGEVTCCYVPDWPAQCICP